jgi:hypothetical protein
MHRTAFGAVHVSRSSCNSGGFGTAEKHRLLNHRLLKHKRVVFVTTRLQRRHAQRIALRFLFLFLLYFDNFAAFIKTAVGTNCVRETHQTTVRAGSQVKGLQGIVRAAIVAATF